jgi:hypothetical protein
MSILAKNLELPSLGAALGGSRSVRHIAVDRVQWFFIQFADRSILEYSTSLF